MNAEKPQNTDPTSLPPIPERDFSLGAQVTDRLRYLAHIASNIFNPDPDYGTPTFEGFQDRLRDTPRP
jgi:hypothetical protein